MDDELLDLADENDRVIGTINRKDYKRLVAENLGYIRSADMFVLNSKGQIYVPVRAPDRTIAPNGFDFSVGGHVAAGEDPWAAILREAKEELGLDLHKDDVEFIDKVMLAEARYFQSLFLLRRDITAQLSQEEFVSASWLYPDDVLRKIADGHPAKDNLPGSIKRLQAYLAKPRFDPQAYNKE